MSKLRSYTDTAVVISLLFEFVACFWTFDDFSSLPAWCAWGIAALSLSFIAYLELSGWRKDVDTKKDI